MILTRQDLSDAHNAHECAEEFRRARDFGGPTELLIWAQNWGNALVDNLLNPEIDDDDLAKAYTEANDLEAKVSHLTGVIETAVKDMDDATELPSERRAAEFERIATDLEKALAE